VILYGMKCIMKVANEYAILYGMKCNRYEGSRSIYMIYYRVKRNMKIADQHI
jgi:hypothetical protein